MDIVARILRNDFQPSVNVVDAIAVIRERRFAAHVLGLESPKYSPQLKRETPNRLRMNHVFIRHLVQDFVTRCSCASVHDTQNCRKMRKSGHLMGKFFCSTIAADFPKKVHPISESFMARLAISTGPPTVILQHPRLRIFRLK